MLSYLIAAKDQESGEGPRSKTGLSLVCFPWPPPLGTPALQGTAKPELPPGAGVVEPSPFQRLQTSRQERRRPAGSARPLGGQGGRGTQYDSRGVSPPRPEPRRRQPGPCGGLRVS